ncbi:MAG: single-stranded DNA-binding protein [Bacteroidales bacterium]|nr:single-stranded DNA-binding protein [Bacteroidales bacterium]
MSLNKVMLIGNVGKDPEVRYLEGNNAGGQQAKVARFPLATSERYRDRSGETRENTEWHNISCWRNNADVVERFVKKGTQLYIEGRIRTRQWTDQTGNKRYQTEIEADTIQLLGRRDENPAQMPASRPYQAAPAPAPAPAPAAVQEAPIDLMPEGGSDDLPF